jgi:hypothetical protein
VQVIEELVDEKEREREREGLSRFIKCTATTPCRLSSGRATGRKEQWDRDISRITALIIPAYIIIYDTAAANRHSAGLCKQAKISGHARSESGGSEARAQE